MKSVPVDIVKFIVCLRYGFLATTMPLKYYLINNQSVLLCNHIRSATDTTGSLKLANIKCFQ